MRSFNKELPIEIQEMIFNHAPQTNLALVCKHWREIHDNIQKRQKINPLVSKLVNLFFDENFFKYPMPGHLSHNLNSKDILKIMYEVFENFLKHLLTYKIVTYKEIKQNIDRLNNDRACEIVFAIMEFHHNKNKKNGGSKCYRNKAIISTSNFSTTNIFIVRFLFYLGFDVNYSVGSINKMTPLSIAVKYWNAELVQKLIDLGAVVDTTASYDGTRKLIDLTENEEIKNILLQASYSKRVSI